MDFDDEEDSGEEEPEQTTTHQSDNVLQLLINRLGPVTFRGAIKVKATLYDGYVPARRQPGPPNTDPPFLLRTPAANGFLASPSPSPSTGARRSVTHPRTPATSR